MNQKKTLFHSSFHESRKGRIINALLAFMTANRYSVIFHFKITLVRRTYQEHRMKQRVLDNLYICLLFAPIIFGFMLYMRHCSPAPFPKSYSSSDSITKQIHPTDTLQMKKLPEAKAK